jgi:hypothetical protein
MSILGRCKKPFTLLNISDDGALELPEKLFDVDLSPLRVEAPADADGLVHHARGDV